jgi:nucleotidyltransferase-like protein
MALTIGKSPLGSSPGGKFNFEIERLPRHLLYLEDFEKRIRGQLAGDTIVDSRRGKLLHETGKLPQWYVPKEDVAEGTGTERASPGASFQRSGHLLPRPRGGPERTGCRVELRAITGRPLFGRPSRFRVR